MYQCLHISGRQHACIDICNCGSVTAVVPVDCVYILCDPLPLKDTFILKVQLVLIFTVDTFSLVLPAEMAFTHGCCHVLQTNCCVESTMRAAYEAGFNVITLTDCCAATRWVS